MKQFSIIDAADQQFGTILDLRRVTIRVRYNPSNDRWSFDMAIDDLPVLHGRRIVTGVDLLAPFGFDLGAIFAVPTVFNPEPQRQAFPANTIRLYYATEAEVEAARASANSTTQEIVYSTPRTAAIPVAPEVPVVPEPPSPPDITIAEAPDTIVAAGVLALTGLVVIAEDPDTLVATGVLALGGAPPGFHWEAVTFNGDPVTFDGDAVVALVED